MRLYFQQNHCRNMAAKFISHYPYLMLNFAQYKKRDWKEIMEH